jgi:hypothetical protein
MTDAVAVVVAMAMAAVPVAAVAVVAAAVVAGESANVAAVKLSARQTAVGVGRHNDVALVEVAAVDA